MTHPPPGADFQTVEVDPQGADALALLREAAIEARALYPEIHTDPQAPWPTNAPTPPRGAYLVVYAQGRPVGMGAHRPLDGMTTEIRRMYVLRSQRRLGVARIILNALEQHAKAQGFGQLCLETGDRQQPAMRLYESFGFVRIPAFGEHANDPHSVCYQKAIDGPPAPSPPRVGVGVLVLR
ncbi:MAG: GNAT family N-acetyltransferase, partial [Burkholderiales bacterium]|nr:GNAT family N-acetyltransferase [Burkholderiales bacterium]